MAYVDPIYSNQYVGDSLSTINNNFANLDTQAINVATTTNTVSGNVIKKGYTVSNISSFVYGTILYPGQGNRSIKNKWSDVYINPQKDPLRVTYTNDNYTRRVFLQGKIYARNIFMACTSFYRLALFSNKTSTTPLDVIEVAACEGNVKYTHGYNTIFQSVYTVQPNTTYTFGLQHWWPSTGAEPGGGISINGWSSVPFSYYAITHPAWSTFMNKYAIWVNPGTSTLAQQTQNMYGNFYAPADGYYTFKTQADNIVNWYVDGIDVVSSSNFTTTISRASVYLTKGKHAMYGSTLNVNNNMAWSQNPAGWAGTISDSNDKILWSTRNLVTGVKGESWRLNTGTTYNYIYADDKTIGFPDTGVNIHSYLKLTVI
jgi:hypothetical protein